MAATLWAREQVEGKEGGEEARSQITGKLETTLSWLHILLKCDVKGLKLWDQEKDTISGFKM